MFDFSPQEKQMITNYVTGGLKVGAGAGALMSVLNYMNDLKRQAQQEPEEDDDTLFLTLPQQPKAASIAAGVGMAGGALSLIGANALVRKLYQMMKRKEIQTELDHAQRAQLTALAPKTAAADANRSLGPVEGLGGGAVALALLTALAGGTLAYKGLDKSFPAVKRPSNPLPKRVKIMAPPQEEVKMASEAGIELVARLALVKAARCDSDLTNLVAAVAAGRYDELHKTASEAGIEAALETCKGAAEVPVRPVAIDIALCLLAKSARFSPIFGLLASSEFFEAYPEISKTAADICQSGDEEQVEGLSKLATFLGICPRVELIVPAIDRMPERKDAGDGPNSVHGEEKAMKSLLAKELSDGKDDHELMKDRMSRNELLGGASGESSSKVTVDARDSREDRGEPREIQELVLGV